MANKKLNTPEVEEIKTEVAPDFEMVNQEEEVITKDDFKLVDNNNYRHDQKFETKPTTFLKDSLKRFGKNKSSVVASVILGVIILLAIFVPVFDTSDVSKSHPEIQYLEPKLNEAGTGFWDGCKTYSDITVDLSTGYPAEYEPAAVRDLKVSDWKEINVVNNYGTGGYVRNFVVAGDVTSDHPTFSSKQTPSKAVFNVNDENKVTITTANESFADYTVVPYNVYFAYFVAGQDNLSKVYLDTDVKTFGSKTYDVSAILKDKVPGVETFISYVIGMEIDNTDSSYSKQFFVESVITETNSNDEVFAEAWNSIGFDDANAMLLLANTEPGYWSCLGMTRAAFKVKIKTCTFTYDTYTAALGDKKMQLGNADMELYVKNGWCKFSYLYHSKTKVTTWEFERLSDRCPVVEIYNVSVSTFHGKEVVNVDTLTTVYKYLGYESMPKFLMGTDKAGKDMFKYVFEGLRTSLIMGVITAAVCFTFGLVWGAISGYFGGNVDLAMERFTDILSGMPWIVVMTLCIVHLGQTFFVFVLALCLTGWIGTAATTRTQFYRFKGREYVLASRTLGASDMRIIFKHILPNAMGTIITGAVLMVPSVIFSEASISYLGLGLKGLSSLGVILSDNQAELLNNPYLLLFPSIIIALLMICFNLFGNGLRDAINPSLKGEDE